MRWGNFKEVSAWGKWYRWTFGLKPLLTHATRGRGIYRIRCYHATRFSGVLTSSPSRHRTRTTKEAFEDDTYLAHSRAIPISQVVSFLLTAHETEGA